MKHTNLDAAFDATDGIWDDRRAYILAVFEAFGIDPDAEYEKPS